MQIPPRAVDAAAGGWMTPQRIRAGRGGKFSTRATVRRRRPSGWRSPPYPPPTQTLWHTGGVDDVSAPPHPHRRRGVGKGRPDACGAEGRPSPCTRTTPGFAVPRVNCGSSTAHIAHSPPWPASTQLSSLIVFGIFPHNSQQSRGGPVTPFVAPPHRPASHRNRRAARTAHRPASGSRVRTVHGGGSTNRRGPAPTGRQVTNPATEVGSCNHSERGGELEDAGMVCPPLPTRTSPPFWPARA